MFQLLLIIFAQHWQAFSKNVLILMFYPVLVGSNMFIVFLSQRKLGVSYIVLHARK